MADGNESLPESPLVIDVVDNVSRGIADHYLIRESQGFFAKGQNIVLDNSGRPRVHDGQKLLLTDADRKRGRLVDEQEKIIEGLFNLDNKALVCIIRGKFYWYFKKQNKFMVLDKQLFPAPDLISGGESLKVPKIRRFQMAQHKNTFIFVCNEEYYRPVVIYLKNMLASEDKTDEELAAQSGDEDVDIYSTDQYIIDGHYLGLPSVTVQKQIGERLEKDKNIPVYESKITVEQEGILNVLDEKPSVDLYDYAFIYSKEFTAEKITYKEYGPISYVKRIDPRKKTISISDPNEFPNDGTAASITKLQKSSYIVRKDDAAAVSNYSQRYLFIKEGRYEAIIYETSRDENSVTFGCMGRKLEIDSQWKVKQFIVQDDPGVYGGKQELETSITVPLDKITTYRHEASTPNIDFETFRPLEYIRVENLDGDPYAFLYTFHRFGYMEYVATLSMGGSDIAPNNIFFQNNTRYVLPDTKWAEGNKFKTILPYAKLIYNSPNLIPGGNPNNVRGLIHVEYDNPTSRWGPRSQYYIFVDLIPPPIKPRSTEITNVYAAIPPIYYTWQSSKSFSSRTVSNSALGVPDTRRFRGKIENLAPIRYNTSTYFQCFMYPSGGSDIYGTVYGVFKNKTQAYASWRSNFNAFPNRNAHTRAFFIYEISNGYRTYNDGKATAQFFSADKINLVLEWKSGYSHAEEDMSVAGVERFKISANRYHYHTLYFYVAFNNYDPTGGTGSVIYIYVEDVKSYRLPGNKYKDLFTLKRMDGELAKPGTIDAGDLDINKDADRSKLKISGTASRDNVLYVLMTTVGGGSDGDSKLAVFNVSQDKNAFLRSSVNPAFKKSLIESVSVASPGNEAEQKRLKLSVTWSHVYIIRMAAGGKIIKFEAYDRYSLIEDTAASYETGGLVTYDLKSTPIQACLMTPYYFLTATNYGNCTIKQEYSSEYRQTPYLDKDGNKKFVNFYSMAPEAPPLSGPDIKDILGPYEYGSNRIYSVNGKTNIDKYYDARRWSTAYNVKKMLYKGLPYTRGTFVLLSGYKDENHENVSAVAYLSANSGTLEGFILPPAPVDSEVSNNFTDISANDELTILYVWMETETVVASDTTYASTLKVYNISDLTGQFTAIKEKGSLWERDSKDRISVPNRIASPAAITEIFNIVFNVPKWKEDEGQNEGSENYNAPDTTLWTSDSNKKITLEMYRQDPHGDNYNFVVKKDMSLKVTTVVEAPTVVDVDDDSEQKKDILFFNITDTGTVHKGYGETRILYTKLENYDKDGNEDFGLDTPPSAKIVTAVNNRILLSDIKQNEISLSKKRGSEEPRISTDALVYSSNIAPTGFPIGNKRYLPHKITYTGAYKSNIIVSGEYNLYRLNANYHPEEINSVVGVSSAGNALLLPGAFLFISDDGIYTTDGFNVKKASQHLDHYFKKNIQGKDTVIFYYALKSKIYVLYKDKVGGNSYSNGLIIDLQFSNFSTIDGLYCTEYIENTYQWPQESGLVGTAWCVYKNVIYKANANGTISFFDEDTRERETLFTGNILIIITLPTVYNFTSGGLDFQSPWRIKHIYRLSVGLNATEGGSVHFYGIGDGGKSRVELRDIDIPIDGRLGDDTTLFNTLSLARTGVITRNFPLGGRFRNNLIYQIGFENGLYLEHSGGSGEWYYGVPRNWAWSTVLNSWSNAYEEEYFLVADVSNIPQKTPRKYRSTFPFLHYVVGFKNMKFDTSALLAKSTAEQTAIFTKSVYEVFEIIKKMRFLLVPTCLPVLNLNNELTNIVGFGIQQSWADIFDLELDRIINDRTIYDPTPFYNIPSEAPLPPVKIPRYGQYARSRAVFNYDDIYLIKYDFDLYSHSTIDLQLLSLTVSGGQGASPNPAADNST